MDKTTAWMLRQDGIAFPCQWHYYGNTDPAEVEETLYAAEWHLFKHVHILHYINPTIKYIHTLCLRVLVEQWLLD